jgi:hypothetical protein
VDAVAAARKKYLEKVGQSAEKKGKTCPMQSTGTILKRSFPTAATGRKFRQLSNPSTST